MKTSVAFVLLLCILSTKSLGEQRPILVYEFPLKNIDNQTEFNKWVILYKYNTSKILKIEQKLFSDSTYKSTENFIEFTPNEFYKFVDFMTLREEKRFILKDQSNKYSIIVYRNSNPIFLSIIKNIYNEINETFDDTLRGINFDQRESFQLISNSSSILRDLGY